MRNLSQDRTKSKHANIGYIRLILQERIELHTFAGVLAPNPITDATIFKFINGVWIGEGYHAFTADPFQKKKHILMWRICMEGGRIKAPEKRVALDRGFSENLSPSSWVKLIDWLIHELECLNTYVQPKPKIMKAPSFMRKIRSSIECEEWHDKMTPNLLHTPKCQSNIHLAKPNQIGTIVSQTKSEQH